MSNGTYHGISGCHTVSDTSKEKIRNTEVVNETTHIYSPVATANTAATDLGKRCKRDSVIFLVRQDTCPWSNYQVSELSLIST